jgi:Flp pilus assembly protein TadD
VYLDHRDVVFVRRIPEHGALIGAHAIDPSRPWTPPEPAPDERPERWKALLGGPGRPWYWHEVADTFLALGSVSNAGVALERGLRAFPHHPRMSAKLAAVHRFLGRTGDADRVMASFGPRSAWHVAGDRLLAKLLMDAGRGAEAAAALERVAAGDPSDHEARLALADLLFQQGRFDAAREHYRALLESGRGGAGEWKKLAYACEQLREPGPAIDAYERSLRVDPAQHEVLWRLGVLRAARGERMQAERDLREALRLKPDFKPARDALAALGRGR